MNKQDLIMLLEFGGWQRSEHMDYYKITKSSCTTLHILVRIDAVKDWSVLMPIYQRVLRLDIKNADTPHLTKALINADLDAFFIELIQLVKWYNKHPALGLKSS